MRVEAITNKRNLIFALFIFLLLLVDQVLKQLAVLYILPGSSFPLVDNFVYLTPVKNRGIFMGTFFFSPYLNTLFAGFVIAIFIALLLINLGKRENLGIAFIISGATGNILDRVLKGGVIDFINVKFWLIFNPADIFIVTGTVLFCLSLTISRKNA